MEILFLYFLNHLLFPEFSKCVFTNLKMPNIRKLFSHARNLIENLPISRKILPISRKMQKKYHYTPIRPLKLVKIYQFRGKIYQFRGKFTNFKENPKKVTLYPKPTPKNGQKLPISRKILPILRKI